MKIQAVLTIFCLLTACSSGEKNSPQTPPDYTIGTIQIFNPWSTGGIHDGAGAAYVTLLNTGTQPDTLLLVSSPACEQVEIHEMIEQDGMRKMRAVQNLVLVPSDSAVLKPGGTHIMLLSLHDSKRKGDTLDLNLTFSRSGSSSIRVPVR